MLFSLTLKYYWKPHRGASITFRHCRNNEFKTQCICSRLCSNWLLTSSARADSPAELYCCSNQIHLIPPFRTSWRPHQLIRGVRLAVWKELKGHSSLYLYQLFTTVISIIGASATGRLFHLCFEWMFFWIFLSAGRRIIVCANGPFATDEPH